MRIFKNIIIGALVISILIFLFSLLFPQSVKVNRDIMVNAPADSIFNKIADLTKWIHWYAPLSDSSEVEKNSLRSSANKLEWITLKGNRNEVILVNRDTSFVELDFLNAGEKKMSGRFILNKTDSGRHTRVEWQTLVKLGWLPWKKFSGIFAEKMIAPGQEASLANLKMLSEAIQ